jgi:membrane-bound lytic murein transglycosylase A
VIDEKGDITKWETLARFVLNQDTGGAIRGAGRADLFWGSGPHAEIAAGHMKHEGDLYILIKKP